MSTINEPQKYYAERNKPVSNGLIQYDSMNMTFWKRQNEREKYELSGSFLVGIGRVLQIFNRGNFEGGKITSLYLDCESVTQYAHVLKIMALCTKEMIKVTKTLQIFR